MFKFNKRYLMNEFIDSIDFLNSHPALNIYDGSFFNNFIFWVNEVCINGVPKDREESEKEVVVSFKRGTQKFDQFKGKYFFAEEDEEESNFDCVDVPYKEVYGNDWKYHHHRYGGEFNIYRYVGKMDGRNSINDYEGYYGDVVYAKTWEELIVECARIVKMNYGDFSYSDMHTDEEKRNNEENNPILLLTDGKTTKMEINRDYIIVLEGELNLRWWKKYKKTFHYDKNWSSVV